MAMSLDASSNRVLAAAAKEAVRSESALRLLLVVVKLLGSSAGLILFVSVECVKQFSCQVANGGWI